VSEVKVSEEHQHIPDYVVKALAALDEDDVKAVVHVFKVLASLKLAGKILVWGVAAPFAVAAGATYGIKSILEFVGLMKGMK